MLKYLVFLGVVVNIIGAWSYIMDTLRGKTKPNRVSWSLWGIVPFIAGCATLSKQLTLSVLPVFAISMSRFLVFLVSFANKKAFWKLSKLDWVCGIGSVLALILWIITRQAAVATALSIVCGVLSCLPTIVKGWKNPETESVKPFAAGLFNALTSFVALRSMTFVELGFPIYLVCADSALMLSIVAGRLRKAHEAKMTLQSNKTKAVRKVKISKARAVA